MALNNHIFTCTFTMDLEKQSQLFREVVAVGSRMRQPEPVHTRMWTMLVDPRQMIQTAKRNLRGDICAVRPEDDKCPMILLEKAKRLVFGSGRGAEGKHTEMSTMPLAYPLANVACEDHPPSVFVIHILFE
jgi:hypothetical protein